MRHHLALRRRRRPPPARGRAPSDRGRRQGRSRRWRPAALPLQQPGCARPRPAPPLRCPPRPAGACPPGVGTVCPAVRASARGPTSSVDARRSNSMPSRLF